MHQAALAERYCLDDPSSSLTKLRLFGEMLAKNIAARFGVYTDTDAQQHEILRELKYRDVLDGKLAEMFHSIRIAGNAAVHEGKGTARDALQNLRFAHQLSVYFYRIFKNSEFKSGPFQVPPNPANASQGLKDELDQARNQILELQGRISNAEKLTAAETTKRKSAEAEAAKAWTEFNAALELAQLTEGQARQEITSYEKKLQTLQSEGAQKTESQVQQTIAFSKTAASRVDLTEADTRKMIDRYLQAAGWQADTAEMRYAKGIRPEKGVHKAIAEWPTQSGPADYVLFHGLTAMAVIEAKRKNVDVYGAIDQAEQRLDEIGFSFDFPLRYYQKAAILAVEQALKEGRRSALLAMANGTGKTKTRIALIYRLLKAQRFRRMLFLVDRSALGVQAANAFKDTEITGLQKFCRYLRHQRVGG